MVTALLLASCCNIVINHDDQLAWYSDYARAEPCLSLRRRRGGNDLLWSEETILAFVASIWDSYIKR